MKLILSLLPFYDINYSLFFKNIDKFDLVLITLKIRLFFVIEAWVFLSQHRKVIREVTIRAAGL
jgi:hypothetical protein